MERWAAVEAKDEFVEISLQVRAAEPVIDAECPGFEVGEHAMNSREDCVGGHFADDMRVVIDARRAGICGPAVGFGGGAFGDIGLNESVQACRRIILDDRRADTPR